MFYCCCIRLVLRICFIVAVLGIVLRICVVVDVVGVVCLFVLMP